MFTPSSRCFIFDWFPLSSEMISSCFLIPNFCLFSGKNLYLNTINGDIKHWYSKITKSNDIQPESAIYTVLERLDIQRIRIREYLDKTSNISEQITIERIVMEIDSKIAQINDKLNFSSNRACTYAIEFLNQHLKSKNDGTRYLGVHDKVAVSSDGKEKIEKIISEDKKNLWSRQN